MLDYMTEPEAYGKCERCFKRYGFPADWVLEPAEVPTLQEDSDSLADLGSETDDCVDTQSETEVVALPLEASVPPALATGQGSGQGLSTGWHPSEMAGVPDGNGAISLHTRSSVFESLCWVAHGAHPAVDI